MNDPSRRRSPTRRARACRAACGSSHNEAQGGWVLLAPERVFKADAIAVEILKRCTGEATFADDRRRSGQDLQRAARAHPADVTAMLRGLADKRLLEL